MTGAHRTSANVRAPLELPPPSAREVFSHSPDGGVITWQASVSNPMSEAAPTPFVFISHSQADASFANDFEKLLAALGIASWNFNSAIKPGDNYLQEVQPVLARCTHIVVLVGPLTKDSRWVDMEMEIAMASREDGPGAALVGVILPNHDDFARPFYEPEAVPLRLHEHLAQQVAVLGKWTDSPSAITTWLQEAARRRRAFQRRTRVSLSTLRQIRERQWTNEGEEPRAALFELSSQHDPESSQ